MTNVNNQQHYHSQLQDTDDTIPVLVISCIKEKGRGYIHLGCNTSRQVQLLQRNHNIILSVKFDCFKDTWRWIPI